MKSRFLSIALVATALVGHSMIADAQSAQPAVSTLTPSKDLVPVLPLGQATSNTSYANPGQIAGALLYTDGGTQTTGFSVTFGAGVVNYIIQPAGTLATGTLTTQASPVTDGQRECFLSTQTQTALTWNANTGQSISGAPTAGVANTPVCMQYTAATATWKRAP